MRRPLTGKANLLVQLEVEAEDGGGLAAQPTAQVNISIVAGTVSPPSFERVQYYFTVPEDTRPGSSVGSIHAYNAQGTTSTPCLVTLCSSFPEYGRGGPLRNREASTQFTKSPHSSAMDLEDGLLAATPFPYFQSHVRLMGSGSLWQSPACHRLPEGSAPELLLVFNVCPQCHVCSDVVQVSSQKRPKGKEEAL